MLYSSIYARQINRYRNIYLFIENKVISQAAVVHLNFRAWSTFPVPVFTVSSGYWVNKAARYSIGLQVEFTYTEGSGVRDLRKKPIRALSHRLLFTFYFFSAVIQKSINSNNVNNNNNNYCKVSINSINIITIITLIRKMLKIITILSR